MSARDHALPPGKIRRYGPVMASTSFYAIIVAGGQGQRTGLSIPKQYAQLGNRAVLDWSVTAFASHPQCKGIVLVVPEGNDEDPTRAADFYDPTFDYFKSLGLQEL